MTLHGELIVHVTVHQVTLAQAKGTVQSRQVLKGGGFCQRELYQVPSERTLTCSVDLFTLTVTKQVHDGCKIAGGFLALVHDLLVQRSRIVL